MMTEDALELHKPPSLSKSLSFEGTGGSFTYHQQYLYPKIVWRRVKQRNTLQQNMNPPGSEHASSAGQTKIDMSADCPSGFALTTEAVPSILVEGQTTVHCPRTTSMSESESTDTNYSEDYTKMTDYRQESDLDSGAIAAYDYSASTSSDELFQESGGGTGTRHEDREASPQISDSFKGIRIDGVKRTSLEGKPAHLVLDTLDMNTPVTGLLEPPPSPEAQVNDLGGNESLFQGHLNKTESSSETQQYSSYEGGCFEDREFDFLKAEPIKRSTSLKTYKTPPGTPHRKKGVRFADALGLDLESVRHILNLEAPPKIPATALKDLQVMSDNEGQKQFAVGSRYLTACFSQPGASSDFLQKVSNQKVMLENCLVDDTEMLITGSIRVANMFYHKKAIVRYTVNNWVTFDDLHASYVANSNDGPTDRFSFTLNIPQYFGVGSKLQFCIMYTTGGTTYWDSNHGNNYSVECYDKVVPFQEQHDQTWLHFL